VADQHRGRPGQTQDRPQPTETPDEAPKRVTALAKLLTTPPEKLAEYKRHGFDQVRLAMVWDQVARDLTLPEFLYFIERCTSTGLDPLRGQIFAIKRRDSSSPTGNKVGHQVSIDGFRAQAAKSGAYAGSDAPEFSEPIRWHDKDAHEICRVTVYRIVQGVRVPFVGETRLSEYYPGEKQGAMWLKYPHNQLAKTAEAQALRKAFPVELGGLLTDGEPMNNDLAAQFADTVMNRSVDLSPDYIELTDTKTGEMTQVRAGDEYARLYPGEDGPWGPEPSSGSSTSDETSKPEEPDSESARIIEARLRVNLCTHPECVEHDTTNKAAADTDPPRCLNHVGA
jgi:phage recombination protein Bet